MCSRRLCTVRTSGLPVCTGIFLSVRSSASLLYFFTTCFHLVRTRPRRAKLCSVPRFPEHVVGWRHRIDSTGDTMTEHSHGIISLAAQPYNDFAHLMPLQVNLDGRLDVQCRHWMHDLGNPRMNRKRHRSNFTPSSCVLSWNLRGLIRRPSVCE